MKQVMATTVTRFPETCHLPPGICDRTFARSNPDTVPKAALPARVHPDWTKIVAEQHHPTMTPGVEVASDSSLISIP